METSIIKLYADCKLKPEKNFMADNIDDFLNKCTNVITKTNQQYIKHNINIEVKLISMEDPSGLSLSFSKGINYNYCSIQNTNEQKPVYYFIINKEWISVGGLKLQLLMDTLNTFKLGEDYELSDKTLITRQHKDRFYPYEFKNSTLSAQITEGINPPVGEFFISKENWDTTRLGTETYTLAGPGIVREYDLNFNLSNEYTGTITSVRGGLYLSIKCDTLNVNLTSSYITSDIYYSFQFTGTLTNAENNYFAYTAFQELILKRKIDFESEGVTSRLLKSSEEEVIDPKNDLTWYYVAITGTSTDSPIETYIMPAEEMAIIPTLSAGSLTKSNFVKGNYYYFGDNISGTPTSIKYKDRNGTLKTLKGEGKADEKDIYILYWNDSTGDLVIKPYRSLRYESYYDRNIINLSSIEFDNNISFRENKEQYLTATRYSYSDMRNIINDKINKSSLKTFLSGDTTVDPQKINSIKDLDRTQKTINKIIELPYCPLDLKYAKIISGTTYYTVPDYVSREEKTYGYNKATLYMLKVNAKYFDSVYNNILTDIVFKDFMVMNENFSTKKNILEESKLYHSDFYIKKFVYDSFNYIFNYELLDYYSITDTTLRFNFVFSKTLNSRFLFDFYDFGLKRSYEDYDNIMVVSRNNQIPVYNSEYLNYLRTDYNYDVKAKNRAAAIQYIGTAKNVINSTTSGATSGAKLGAAGGPVGAAVGAVVGGLYGAGSSIYGEVAQAQARNDAFNQKIDNLKYQAASVDSSDDIDLLSYYTNQRAKLIEYKASDKIIKAVYDMFYFTGYTGSTQEVPDLNTRKNWNYCQCTPDIINTKNIPDYVINNIAVRMEAGFTVFHNDKDLDQKLENKEIWRIIH